jgi:glycosyltransferase involved in cell wall biosynthesis
MKRADADIYYTSCAGAVVGQVVMFARLHGRKVIFRIASNSDCDPRSLLIRFWRDKKLYRYGLTRADLVLAQTHQQQQALLRNFGRGSRVVASLTESGGRRRSFHDRDIGVLWVGNIRPLKRPSLLLDAARRLPEIEFHMIGGRMPGAEALFEAVRVEALALPNVRFHGAVPYHQVAEFYERARVFAGTSEIEGFPNTYMQAWAHGTPVVAFLDPDQLIARNGTGHAVKNVEEMRSYIATLAHDPSAWEEVSQRCRDYIDSRVDESEMVMPYVEALCNLCTTGTA